MAAKNVFQGLPWWVTWIAIPVLVLAVFGGLIVTVLGFVAWLAFRLLLLVALVGGLIYAVRKFTSSSSSSRGDW
ncbi:DUF5326 family protein [Streptomyces sp. XD-27]|uniref:DUF5326 family protein n=1 Tax=Streptomyces sp. XD-27 TaxID=3062779 RepID=UPI0026F417FC|nr:DUF5326 family protein [Streptomyces sp. XD-27]WKX74330.1 DUF5326 family protein [Streptomyces sp. XD-27]